jgi:hypothetical protein
VGRVDHAAIVGDKQIERMAKALLDRESGGHLHGIASP